MEEGRVRAAGEGMGLLLLSLLMSRLGIAVMISVAPLLFFRIRHSRKSTYLLLVIAFIVNLLVSGFLDGFFSAGKEGLALLIINMYIPLSLSAAGIMWLGTEGRKILGRLFLTLVPALLILGASALFFLSDRALLENIYTGYENAFTAVAGPVLETLLPGVDMALLSFSALMVFAAFLFPVLLCGICASCFIYETAKHSRESGWEEKVIALEYSPDAVWGFIISWALVLLFRFVSAPLLLWIAVWNLALVWTVIYAVEGFSVLFARLRRHSPMLRSMTLLFLVIVLGTLVPGINFVVLIGLPLLGVLESFFDLKKRGGENEDHS
ncbi:MAG: hypothetical protein IAA97_01080 [Spirochaetes bacterium]|uniref:DUF2232 domain-containing protein n=1 Tax=Candidatus Ornithospirochaeta stercoripullorum TaxID=2840899 RepID=A0A9D9H1L4_9SPIO|nr:hypothetical protein [Candidatus Ornithospirochaeta stercoripullorum]